MSDLTMWLGVLMVLAFFVNIVVLISKEFIHIPSKLWAMLVSLITTTLSLCAGVSWGWFKATAGMVILSFAGSFVIAYVAMYGFDTFKELWERFKDGENIGS